MELEELQQKISALLENMVEHSNACKEKEHISSLDVGHFLKKTNQLQRDLIVLSYLMENKPQKTNKSTEKVEEPPAQQAITTEEPQLQEVKNEPNAPSPKEAGLENLPISQLSEGLTLNDRYLFANELCQKDMNAFNQLVKNIDNCTSYDEAIHQFSALSLDLENEQVTAFIHLVERRFS